MSQSLFSCEFLIMICRGAAKTKIPSLSKKSTQHSIRILYRDYQASSLHILRGSLSISRMQIQSKKYLMHWKKCYFLTLLECKIGTENMICFAIDMPILTQENSECFFFSIFKSDLGNFKLGPSSPQTVHSSHHKGNVYCTIRQILPVVLPEVKTDF